MSALNRKMFTRGYQAGTPGTTISNDFNWFDHNVELPINVIARERNKRNLPGTWDSLLAQAEKLEQGMSIAEIFEDDVVDPTYEPLISSKIDRGLGAEEIQAEFFEDSGFKVPLWQIKKLGAPSVSNEADIKKEIKNFSQDLTELETNLKPNEYKASDGSIMKIDPDILTNILNNEKVFKIQALIQNPEAKYGSNLKEIFRDVVGRRSSERSSLDPSAIKFGEKLPGYMNLQSAYRDFYGSVGEGGLEAIEGLINVGRGTFSGFFGEKQEEFGDWDIFKTERYPFGEDKLLGGFEGGILPDRSGALRFGIPALKLDKILAGAATDTTPPSIDEEAPSSNIKGAFDPDYVGGPDETVVKGGLDPIMPKDPTTITEDVDAEVSGKINENGEEVPTESETIARGTLGDPTFTPAPAPTPSPTPAPTPAPTPDVVKQPADYGGAFADTLQKISAVPNIRNTLELLQGGAQTLSALNLAEEAALEKDTRAYQAAIAKEKAKAILSGGDFTVTNLFKVNESKLEMNEEIGFYEGGEQAVSFMNQAIKLFEDAVDNGTAVTGLPGRVNRFKDEVATFFNIPVSELSDATQIHNFIEMVKQRSIKDVLNESGKTISNIDRDILDRIFGGLDFTTPPAVQLKKLIASRDNLVNNQRTRQRKIQGIHTTLQDPLLRGRGMLDAENLSLLQRILTADPVNPALQFYETGQSIGAPVYNLSGQIISE